MKIIVTGSLGHIGEPLTKTLVSEKHAVTVISSNAERSAAIEALGATPAIGSLHDVNFLTKVFTGADAVFTMVPPGNYTDPDLNILNYYSTLGRNYAQAIEQTGVKRVVNLSSIGAHLSKGNGILVGAHNVELLLNNLPSNVAITHLRPTSFYYNLYGYAGMIKNLGFIAANYGGEDIVPWVAPVDIAAVAAEELTTPSHGIKVRYIASDDRSCNDAARLIGAAINKPGLEWKLISKDESQAGLQAAGINPGIAAGLAEMYEALHTGLLAEDYYRHKPQMGKVKLEDFVQEFAAAFNNSK